jgi:hypothetical protein
MADGRERIGGLSDRLRAIVSVFKLCKELGIAFKINFTSPFNLKDFLLPNVYDWNILPQEICYNTRQSIPKCIFTRPCPFHDNEAQEFWAKKFFCENYKQIHIYTNMLTGKSEYSILFHELFKPTIELQKLIDYNLKRLGGSGGFISVAFRFMQLLGDFNEPNNVFFARYNAILPDNKREVLINNCIEHLKEIRNENDCGKILVTSDSMSFLERIKNLPFVYVIPGEAQHIDAHQNTSQDVNQKMFLDYFVLSYSKIIYLVVEDQMYESWFSHMAALLNNVPFIVKRY